MRMRRVTGILPQSDPAIRALRAAGDDEQGEIVECD